MNKCRLCGCSDSSPCFTDDKGARHTLESLAAFSDENLEEIDLVPCSWIEWNLCSACVESPTPPPLLWDAHGRPLRGAP